MKNLSFTLLTVLSACSYATIFNEVEPNNTRETANAFTLGFGDRINGNTNGSGLETRDFFSVSSPSLPFGIYRHFFSDNRSPFGGGTRFLEEQEITINQMYFYTFGSGSPINTMLSKESSFTNPSEYSLGHFYEQVTPTNLGTFQPGTFRFIERHPSSSTARIDMQLFDSEGRPVPGGWDVVNSTQQFDFSVGLNPGTYYLLSGVALRSETTFRSNPEWPLLGSGNVIATNVVGSSFRRDASIDVVTPTSTINVRAGEVITAQESAVATYSFTVVPEPASLSALAIGVFALCRRKRCQA